MMRSFLLSPLSPRGVVALLFSLSGLQSVGCTSYTTLAPFTLELRSPEAGGTISAGYHPFEFLLNAENSGAPLTLGDSDLFLNYEKKLHAFVFDEALEEFQHLHPEESSEEAGVWKMPILLQRQGKYQIWVDGLVKGRNTEILLASSNFEVTSGGLNAHEVPTALTPLTLGSDDVSQVEIEWLKGPAIGANNQLRLRFSRTDQSTPEIQDYLGASAHVTGARLGGGDLVHIHGMELTENGQPVVYLEGVLSQPGDYRLWVQFNDAGELRTVPLAFRLEE